MIKQPLAFLEGDPGVWTCAWCAGTVRDNVMSHRDDCRWIDEIRDEDSVQFYDPVPGTDDKED